MPNNEYLVTNAELTATADAIRVKTGSSSPIEWKSNSGFADSVDSIPTSRIEADYGKPVKFFDYDGFLVYSYTPEELAALTAMPDNPSHEGLTAQGWNWTLAQAQTYVASYGQLNIGQMYTSSDGKTKIHIRINDGRLIPYLGLAVNGSADIDWGDGSAHDTLSGSSLSDAVYVAHSYASAGEYTISVDVTGNASIVGSTNGSYLLRRSNVGDSGNDDKIYESAIISVNIGDNMEVGDYAFQNCYSLITITIPHSATSIGSYVFHSCYSFRGLTLPDSITSTGRNIMMNCYSATSVAFSSSVTSVARNAFQGCNSLSSVSIPDSITSFTSYLFSGCHSLASIVVPLTVSTIETYVFQSCYSLSFVKFYRSTPPVCSNMNAWGVSSDFKIIYPYEGTIAYKSATNYPDKDTYLYLGFYSGTDGEVLPTTVTDGIITYNLTWFATIDDAFSGVSPITTMQGTEVYCRSVLVS
ncbi:MAG: leucine-rich repeat domain-containing protein [Methanobrevibacter sp.]|nr:leucine-rich repeat domain-containing protein [Methanobrevibacter sp.]